MTLFIILRNYLFNIVILFPIFTYDLPISLTIGGFKYSLTHSAHFAVCTHLYFITTCLLPQRYLVIKIIMLQPSTIWFSWEFGYMTSAAAIRCCAQKGLNNIDEKRGFYITSLKIFNPRAEKHWKYLVCQWGWSDEQFPYRSFRVSGTVIYFLLQSTP